MVLQGLLRGCAVWVACCLSSLCVAGVNGWTTLGPPGGTYRNFEASTTDGNVFYAAYSRSFHRSTDGGLTWHAHDFDGEVVNISVHPVDGNRLCIAVLGEGVYRSTDGGQTFTLIVPGATQQIWACGMGPDNVVYYASLSEFRRSENGGDTFGLPTSIQQTFERIYVNPQDADLLYVIRGTQLLRSTNGGTSWTESAIGPSVNWIYALAELPGGSLVAATGLGIYTRNNDAASWQLRATGVHWSVSADPLAPTTLIASRNGSVPLIRSVDGGLNWSEIGTATAGRARRALISRAGSNVFITANEIGVQRSMDSGATWQQAVRGPISSGSFSMATTLAPGASIYAYEPYGALFVSSGGSNWERRGDSLRSLELGSAELAVRPGSPQTLYLAAFQRGVYRSVDGGLSWTAPGLGLQGLGVNAMSFDPGDPDTMYATVSDIPSNPASIYRSTDGGTSWSAHSEDLNGIFGREIVIDPANGNRMFVAGYEGVIGNDIGGLYLSINAGINWTRVAFAGEDVFDVDIDPSDSNRIYVATSTGLYISTNGGVTFAPNAPFAAITGVGAGAIAIDPVIPSMLYVTSTYDPPCCAPMPSSFVLRSVDRGQSWEILRDQSAPTWFVNEIMLDPNTPSRIHVDTSVRGIASYETANDLSLTMSGHSGERIVGEPASFSLRAQHLGASAATGVTLSTMIASGLTNVLATTDRGTCAVSDGRITCSVPVLRPGEDVNVQVTYTPATPAILDFEGVVSAHEGDSVPTNNTAGGYALAGEVVDLGVSVIATPTVVDRGDSFIYAALVSNNGPLASSSTTLSFAAGAGLTFLSAPAQCTVAQTEVTCDLGQLPLGETERLEFSASADSTGQLVATATVSQAQSAGDANPQNNTMSSTVTSRPIVDVVVSATDTADPVIVGDSFDYVVTLTNQGPETAPNLIARLSTAATVTAVFPGLATCDNVAGVIQCILAELAAGASETITITVATTAVVTLQMTATVTSNGADTVTSNNTIEHTTAVSSAPSTGGGGSESSGGGGGGGGSIGWFALTLLALLARARRAWKKRLPQTVPLVAVDG